jgi:hypothetical protein
MVQLLLEPGVTEVNSKDDEGCTSLLLATKEDNGAVM